MTLILYYNTRCDRIPRIGNSWPHSRGSLGVRCRPSVLQEARQGTLSGIVYVRADPAADPERYLLHKRDKGDPGTDLKSLVYVRSIQLGAMALEEGKRKAAGTASQKASAASGKGRS